MDELDELELLVGFNQLTSLGAPGGRVGPVFGLRTPSYGQVRMTSGMQIHRWAYCVIRIITTNNKRSLAMQ